MIVRAGRNSRPHAWDKYIASLSVARVNDRFVGISQPMDLAKRRYWYSTDLLKWEKGPKVLFNASAAAETLSNPFLVDGKWNIVYE